MNSKINSSASLFVKPADLREGVLYTFKYSCSTFKEIGFVIGGRFLVINSNNPYIQNFRPYFWLGNILERENLEGHFERETGEVTLSNGDN